VCVLCKLTCAATPAGDDAAGKEAHHDYMLAVLVQQYGQQVSNALV
jgi:hypothetical protein